MVSIGTEYTGNHKTHSKDSSGASNLVCTVTSGTAGFCDGVIAVGTSLLLVDHVNVNLGDNTPLTVNGGTGKYKGAERHDQASSVGNTNNNDFTIRITY